MTASTTQIAGSSSCTAPTDAWQIVLQQAEMYDNRKASIKRIATLHKLGRSIAPAEPTWIPEPCYNCTEPQCTRHKNGKLQECRIRIEQELRQAWRQRAYNAKHASYCQYCTEYLIERNADNATDPCHECQIRYHEEHNSSDSSLSRESNQMELI